MGGSAGRGRRIVVSQRAFRVGFDDVINNELSGVFIRNDTNSEVIKIRSFGAPRGEMESGTSTYGLKSP